MTQKCLHKLKPKGMVWWTLKITISINFNTETFDAIKRNESTEVEGRTWLHLPSGTLWSTSSDTHHCTLLNLNTNAHSIYIFMYIIVLEMYSIKSNPWRNGHRFWQCISSFVLYIVIGWHWVRISLLARLRVYFLHLGLLKVKRLLLMYFYIQGREGVYQNF